MVTPAESPLAGFLERLALFLTLLGILLRWLVCGEVAGSGFNLLIHLLFWLALASWFLGRALAGSAPWRFTGAEFALLGLTAAALISLLRAPYKLAAFDTAMAWMSYAILFILALNLVGRNALLGIFFPTACALAFYAILQNVLLLPLIRRDEGVWAALPVELQRRVQSGEVFATFLYPNTFAGFLILAIPILLGSLLDARHLRPQTKALKGTALGLCAIALFLTGSKGGWIALAAGLAAFAALAWTRERGRGPVLATGGTLAAVLVVLLLCGAIPERVAANPSVRARIAYARGARAMISEAPLLGSGLGSFQDLYPQHKPEIQQETRKAHNDYLQVLAETGLVGFLPFLALLGLGLFRALRREVVTEAPPQPALPPWLVTGAAATAFLAAYLLKGVFGMTGGPGGFVALLILGGWVAYYLLARRGEETTSGGPLLFTRIGAAAALVGILLHMMVDFDFHEMGVAMSLFLVLALITDLQTPPADSRLPRAACGIGAALALVICAPLLAWAAPRAIEADAALQEAEETLRKIGDPAHARRIDPALLDRALESSAKAQTLNPLQAEACDLYAQAEFLSWGFTRDNLEQGDLYLTRLREREDVTLLAIDRAILLRPDASVYHARKSEFHRGFRLFYLSRPDPRGTHRSAADAHLLQAQASQARAASLYPTHAPTVYDEARLRELRGDEEGAGRRYREALRLGDLAAAEYYASERLQLAPLPKARALRAVNRPLDAHQVLTGHLRTFTAGRPPDKVKELFDMIRRRPWLLGGQPDEADDAMRPVIGDALDAILRELPK